MRLLAFALLGLLLLSGCAGKPAPAETSASPTMTYVTTAAPATPPVQYTDTIHVGSPPAWGTAPPDVQRPLHVPIPAFVGRSDFTDSWNLTLAQDTTALTGTAVMWGEVNGTVLNDLSPLGGNCFWDFSVTTGDNTHLEPVYSSKCGVEAATVAPGIRQPTFPIDITGVQWPAGTVLHCEFHTQDFARAPGAQVDLLTGSVPYDSTITIAGLHLPLDPASLLGSATPK